MDYINYEVIIKKERKRFYWKFFVDLFVIVILIFAFMYILGYFHELAHSEIYRHYGINSEIFMFKYFPDLITLAESPCPNDTCTLAHNIIDGVGYHLLVMTAIILMLFGILYMNIIGKEQYTRMTDLNKLQYLQEIVRVASQ